MWALKLRACAVLLALGLQPATAWADAPRDIQTNQRLWLDGLDVNGTDTGNGTGSNPANGAQVTAWKDKSPNGYTAGDAVSYGATAHSFPTYAANVGISCDGISNVLQVQGGIYPKDVTVYNRDIIIVASTWKSKNQVLFQSAAVYGGANNVINAFVPNGGDTIAWAHGSTYDLSTSWSASGAQFNRAYIYNFGATQGGSMIIARDGASLASGTNSSTYIHNSIQHFFLCGGDNVFPVHHGGEVSEIIIYDRRLNTPEKNILQSYLAAKYANPGGAGAASRYTVVGSFRYYVGGIGQEGGGSLATGTSAGLTIANQTFLGNGRYLLLGTDSLNPAKGVAFTDLPAGYTARAARTWYATRTGGGNGNATMTFNLAQLGLAANTGTQLALFYRSGATGAYTASAVGTYDGSGTISFTASNPQSGYYTLGGSMTAVAGGAPAISLSLTSSVVSDGVSASNFKAVPGALLHASAVATK